MSGSETISQFFATDHSGESLVPIHVVEDGGNVGQIFFHEDGFVVLGVFVVILFVEDSGLGMGYHMLRFNVANVYVGSVSGVGFVSANSFQFFWLYVDDGQIFQDFVGS